MATQTVAQTRARSTQVVYGDALKGKKVGLGAGADIDISKVLIGEDRKLAQEAFSAGVETHDPAYPPWITPLNVILQTFCVYSAVSYTLAGQVPVVGLSFMILISFLFVDMASGLLHLVLDNPKFLVGPIAEFARGFQEHHLNTALISKLTPWNHMRVVQMPVVISAAVGLPMCYNNPYFYFYIPMLCGLLFYMQMCHRWAHMVPEKRGAVVQALQDYNLALHPKVHLIHHRPPYDNTFCIMNGVCNPVLDWIVLNVPALNCHSKLWAPVFVAYCILPFCVFRAIS